MCSQPPVAKDDGWRLAELLETIALIDLDERQLGITGGEPTLLEGLPIVIAACRDRLPGTRLHVLSNGRRFADAAFAERIADIGHPDLVWAVPLYADLPEHHDWIVQAEGAFAETLQGLYHLALWRQRVEIRVVLHRPTIDRLPELASFIGRMLPFAEHVAFMGLEPMGFARQNRDLLWIDPADYGDRLSQSCLHLANRGMALSIYNLPLCVLPAGLRAFARKSISDWKNDFVEACAVCAAQAQCAGFFSSASSSWRSRAIRPLTVHEVGAAVRTGGCA
jgi:His-Xaa-Ser system radical SAM maturase HxsC